MEDRNPKTSAKYPAGARSKEPSEGFRARTLSRSSSAGVTPEERRQLIAKAAYYRAERRGFTPGSELEDWLQAEVEVERTLRRGTTAA